VSSNWRVDFICEAQRELTLGDVASRRAELVSRQEEVMNMSDELRQIQNALREFAIARDWEVYHTPKNLVAALSVEASELLELFQWLTAEQSMAANHSAALSKAVREEMADVFLYLLRLADILNVDLLASAREKILINEQKYPVEQARGNADKYNRRNDQE